MDERTDANNVDRLAWRAENRDWMMHNLSWQRNANLSHPVDTIA